MSDIDTFTLRQGDRLPNLVRILKNADGTAIDLTGATVTFRMRRRDVRGGSLISGACSLSGTPTDGQATYAWGASDSAEPGEYNGEFRVVKSGLQMTVPNGAFVAVIITPAL